MRMKILICTAFCLFTHTQAWALKTDSKQPMSFNADHSISEVSTGQTHLQGNVVIRQGSLHIRADQALITGENGALSKVELKGQPVYWDMETEAHGQMKAQAEQIDFLQKEDIVHLRNQVILEQAGSIMKGEAFSFVRSTGQVKGGAEDGSQGRVQIIFTPKT